MATARKDFRGRVLRKGEVQRASDKRYMYCYTDPFGRRKYIYANDLVTLREKNQLDGLDTYVAGYATVNFVFDRYISLKTNLRETTRSNYLYMYDRHVRETFGERKIADIKYSDVLQFYNYLVVMKGLQTNTLESIHCLLHPTFQLAFRDDIIRKTIQFTITGGRCSRYCWEQGAVLVKRLDCAGTTWTMTNAQSASIIVWSITLLEKIALLFCIFQSLRLMQVFGRFQCLIR